MVTVQSNAELAILLKCHMNQQVIDTVFKQASDIDFMNCSHKTKKTM